MMDKMKYGLAGIFLLLLLALLTSCHSKKMVTEIVVDSVRVEYKEKVVKVPVTTVIEIPSEHYEVETRDTFSTLETSYAVSKASILWDDKTPVLHHSLQNKPQMIVRTDTVLTVQKECKEEKSHYSNEAKVIEKELSKYDKLCLKTGKVVIVVLPIVVMLLCVIISNNRLFHVR